MWIAIMPLTPNKNVFITCAVTGSGGTQDRSSHVPRSPKQIANSAIDAAKAGAAVVHCHVRDPDTGEPSRKLEYYREVTDRIRDSDVDVVLNLTAGMGGDMVFGGGENPLPPIDGTDMVGPQERVAHIAECLPEICTLDCGTMNFAEADYVMTNTPGALREMGRLMTQLKVRPEIEAFDTGHLWFAKQLVEEGCRRAGCFLRFQLAEIRCLMWQLQYLRVAMYGLVLKTISGLRKMFWRPTPSWWKGQ